MKRFFSQIFSQEWKNLYHLAGAVFANIAFGFPARSFTVIGVTGTNGKTTATQMIGTILRTANKKVAVASTIDFWIQNERKVNESKFTTTSSWELQKFFKKAKKAGCEYMVLETSSHALHQNRVWGIPFAIGVITNITREHLDYHRTMEEYREAKKILFKKAKKAVVNADMVRPLEITQVVRGPVLTYSTKSPEADITAIGIQLDFHRTEFRVEDVLYQLHVPGLFNIENALAAIGVAQFLNIPTSDVQKALASITGIPGRMELVQNAQKIDIIIDYAVTPDAFEKLYQSILPLKIPGTKIIHVFGSCGERDRGKRPVLGEIASKAADVVILTNEDPYHEDGERIIDEIEPGVERFKIKEKNYFRVYDREAAIRKAIQMAEIGDIVLLTGKGAETSMALGDQRVLWNERAVVEKILKEQSV